MRYGRVSLLLLGFCLLLVGLVSAGMGDDVVAGKAGASCPGLPFYGEQEFLLRVKDDLPTYEPMLTAADFNGDELEDILILRSKFQTKLTFDLDILLNDGQGGLVLATDSVFTGQVPAVQHQTEVVVADFNGDGRNDFFVADHGYDVTPHPGYQNQLALSTVNGKMVDATSNLPQQSDFSHSACAADIDDDDDIDLYVGNIWGQNEIGPQLLLNDGSGRFTVGEKRLPPLMDLNQNGYTTCAFSDVNNDDAPDLVLGDAGDDIDNEHSTPNSEVLLNDGAGVFALLPNGMPPKGISAYDIGHDIEMLDLNGDAYVDLLIVYEGWEGPFEGWRGSYIQALVNKGNGTFRDETATRMHMPNRQVGIPELELRDLDDDGDQDLLAFPWDDQNPDPLLFMNDGRGVFRWRPFYFGVGDLYYTFLDLGGNGGHDIVYATYAPPEDIYAVRDLGCALFLPVVNRD